jgi:hypothetical protein
MDYTPRTLIRHLALFALLMSVPAWSNPAWLLWFANHIGFYAVLLPLAVGAGLVADWLAREGILGRAWLRLVARLLRRPTLLRRAANATVATPRPINWVYLWAACSRCIAYWSAFALGFALAWALWPWNAGWTMWLPRVYFGLVSASAASSVAVGAFLFREIRSTNDGEDSP